MNQVGLSPGDLRKGHCLRFINCSAARWKSRMGRFLRMRHPLASSSEDPRLSLCPLACSRTPGLTRSRVAWFVCKILFVLYLKFKFNWVFCILSGNPTANPSSGRRRTNCIKDNFLPHWAREQFPKCWEEWKPVTMKRKEVSSNWKQTNKQKPKAVTRDWEDR